MPQSMSGVCSIVLFLFSLQLTAQLSALKTSNWHEAGFRGTYPVYTQTLNIMNYGGSISGAENNSALSSAIAALNGAPGVVFFPAGVYSFTGQVNVNRDSILFVGEGHTATRWEFEMAGTLNHCVNISGSTFSGDSSSVKKDAGRGTNTVEVQSAAAFKTGDWVYLQCNDSAFMASSWAYRSLGQILRITAVNGNTISFHSPFRFNYVLPLKPVITRIVPRQGIGVECLAISRKDATSFQTSLLAFDKAVQCWVKGVEGDSTNYAHVELNRCANISIYNSWFHHAFGYGGGGQAYGIVFQYSASECRAENNVFEHLRHSLLFQAGANGNVAAYNYSFDPFWQQSFFPVNSAGDVVFHGNYPFFNLVEGNVNQNTVIDNSHGQNGPFNTFFRNRMELYGLIMNAGAGDSMQYVANEIPNTGALMGNYNLTGTGHLQHNNLVRGIVTPSAQPDLPGPSLLYSTAQLPLCFNVDSQQWPLFGFAGSAEENAAKNRVKRGIKAECECSYEINTGVKVESSSHSFKVFPNPADKELFVVGEAEPFSFCTPDQRVLFTFTAGEACRLDVSKIPSGCYLLKTKQRCYRVIILH